MIRAMSSDRSKSANLSEPRDAVLFLTVKLVRRRFSRPVAAPPVGTGRHTATLAAMKWRRTLWAPQRFPVRSGRKRAHLPGSPCCHRLLRRHFILATALTERPDRDRTHTPSTENPDTLLPHRNWNLPRQHEYKTTYYNLSTTKNQSKSCTD